MKSNLRVMFFVVMMIVGIMAAFHAPANADDKQLDMYGKVDTIAMNAGILKLSGSVECRKYFDECVLKEHWLGPILQSRDTVNVVQMVIMRTGVTNPTIISVEDHGDKKLVINFTYESDNHKHWIPVFED